MTQSIADVFRSTEMIAPLISDWKDGTHILAFTLHVREGSPEWQTLEAAGLLALCRPFSQTETGLEVAQ
jgi:hypothetical protein